MIRTKLGSSDWRLEHNFVERVYKNAGEHTRLRHMIAAVLGTIQTPFMNSDTYKKITESSASAPGIVGRWRGHFLKESDLGAVDFCNDYLVMKKKRVTRRCNMSVP